MDFRSRAGEFSAEKAEQSAGSLTAINVSFAWVPVVTSVICIICMLLFDLDKKYDKAVEDLSKGKHREV